MRVAMLAILLSPVSRSTNIARVLHLIDAAASRDPGLDGEAIVLSDESYLCERMSVTEGQIVTAEVAQQTGARRTPDR